MAEAVKSYDPIWDEIYENGHTQKAPWDGVVSFVFRHRPRDRDFSQIKLLEVGCGTASNLRFFAKEKFQVWGIEGSTKAVETANNYFKEDGVAGNIAVGDFTKLDFPAAMFDMAIDRAALCCAGLSDQRKAIAEIHRTLRAGGKFIFTPYADTHASRASGVPGPDGLTMNISAGTIVGVGQICYLSEQDVKNLLPSNQWKILSMEYQTSQDIMADPSVSLHSSWRVIVEKI